MNRLAVRAACAASLIIGLFFVFVWAPHPWGWVGFDQYYNLAQVLSRGEPFPTTDVPWGYAYFVSIFYRLFGERLWMPLLVQVVANASMPALAYAIASRLFDERVATVTAVLIGLLSFNTVYASTQSSDAICNVLFMVGVWVLLRARQHERWRDYAVVGAIFGIAPQFRPNLILIPALLAAFVVLASRDRFRATRHASVLVAASVLMLTPWLLRTYQLTGEIIPTSTHGGVQLWYGTLQTGSYLQSRAHNPRSVFEAGSFPYTSLDHVPLIVSGNSARCAANSPRLHVVYWTDRDPTHHSSPVLGGGDGQFQAELPISPAPTTYYYSIDGAEPAGAGAPHVFFVSSDHLGDLDTHGDVLDVFDIVRLVRSVAWNEPLPFDARLDFDGDGRLSASDLGADVDQLARAADPPRTAGPGRVTTTSSTAKLTFADGSGIEIPKVWSGRITDIAFSGDTAEAVLHTSVPFTQLRRVAQPSALTRCAGIEKLGVNTVFYREQPHMMRRYTALAFDNIRRDPGAYAVSVLYRMVRVFFVEGSDDPHTTHQFSGGGRVYRAAFVISIVLLLLALVGMWLAWRRGAAMVLPALLVAYIPATLAFVLTNMRYSITVQPLLFMFVAVTIVTVLERGRWMTLDRAGATETPFREETQTARRP
jgi:Dolichyl-phosphate-mannose-protein mannosyltransferase